MDSVSAKDPSAGDANSKFPSGEPNKEWTIEQLLHYTLHQFHQAADESTAAMIAECQRKCDEECEGIQYMHKLAVDMANNGKNATVSETNVDDENVDPQKGPIASTGLKDDSDSKAALIKSSSANTNSSAAANSTANAPNANSPPSLQIQILAGPHAGSKFLLRPKAGTPCLIGRSKGKKFVKNGVSLHKDQEVSTTHGKFLVEGGMSLPESEGDATTGGVRFYFIDMGSTNGTFYNGETVEPNVKLELHEGMEIRVGNSNLKIVFG